MKRAKDHTGSSVLNDLGRHRGSFAFLTYSIGVYLTFPRAEPHPKSLSLVLTCGLLPLFVCVQCLGPLKELTGVELCVEGLTDVSMLAKCPRLTSLSLSGKTGRQMVMGR